MGIPSYFSHIVKNYANILFSLKHHRKIGTNFDSLYMDCNSIIYDSYHQMTKDAPSYKKQGSGSGSGSGSLFNESDLICNVISKIDTYIRMISPNQCIYIAFDGVAPVAKMKQQRTRRYKSLYMSSILGETSVWNTSAITPGTPFMARLSSDIKQSFHNKESVYGVKQLIVSAADVAGEGEHKMFQHLRDNASANNNVAVYGLDADLIMLAIFHYHLCKNIYVFREAPEFAKSKVFATNSVSGANDTLFMDISGLCDSIINEMGCKHRDRHQIYDYAFMCFFLGNDFLPHFPSLNIRTHGIQVLLDNYREVVGKIVDARFISNTTGNIQWNWVGKFIQALAENERELWIQEHERRDKMDSYVWDVSDREKLIHNTPIICREIEKYICPTQDGWKTRYYRALLEDDKEAHIKKICQNYLEGLEWVFKYYTEGCVHWKWSYHYNYPPLLSDLVSYIPAREKTLIRKTHGYNKSLNPKTQLAYVLPHELYGSLLGDEVANYLQTHYSYLYQGRHQFVWAYCRYFWESHLHIQDVPIEILEKWDSLKIFR